MNVAVSLGGKTSTASFSRATEVRVPLNDGTVLLIKELDQEIAVLVYEEEDEGPECIWSKLNG